VLLNRRRADDGVPLRLTSGSKESQCSTPSWLGMEPSTVCRMARPTAPASGTRCPAGGRRARYAVPGSGSTGNAVRSPNGELTLAHVRRASSCFCARGWCDGAGGWSN
jgi:hypothetical protein